MSNLKKAFESVESYQNGSINKNNKTILKKENSSEIEIIFYDSFIFYFWS